MVQTQAIASKMCCLVETNLQRKAVTIITSYLILDAAGLAGILFILLDAFGICQEDKDRSELTHLVLSLGFALLLLVFITVDNFMNIYCWSGVSKADVNVCSRYLFYSRTVTALSIAAALISIIAVSASMVLSSAVTSGVIIIHTSLRILGLNFIESLIDDIEANPSNYKSPLDEGPSLDTQVLKV